MAPNLVSINNARAIKGATVECIVLLSRNIIDLVADVYGVNVNVRKGTVYEGSVGRFGHTNTFNCRDRELHARKRRLLAPDFTDSALALMMDHIIKHVDRLVDTMSVGTVLPKQKQEHGSPYPELDMGDWANYLTFDIMGDLVFGDDLGLLQDKGSRGLPKVIDAAIHHQYAVRSC